MNKQFEDTKKELSHHILFIEDDENCQLAVQTSAHEINCNINVANNASEALEMLKKPYDLIIMDIGLPGMDGIALAKKIRKELHLDTPIIASTAHEWDKKEYLKAGINGLLKKPIVKIKLEKLLKKVF